MKERCIRFFDCTIGESRVKLTFSLYDALMFVILYLLITFVEFIAPVTGRSNFPNYMQILFDLLANNEMVSGIAFSSQFPSHL